uniref:Plac8 onzin related protein 6 n=1 Tax=Tetraodon nigroviridis TaxID=99883 RepID=H3BZN5_TETNG
MAAEAWTDWHTNLCDCLDDTSTCCYGFWCCPCLACTVSSRFGENACLPSCDILSLSLMAALGIPLFGPPPAALALRSSIRNRYRIKGSICRDIATTCFCVWCSWCQMHREVNYRRNQPTVLNVVSVQPAPAAQPNPVIRTYPLLTHTYPPHPHTCPPRTHTYPPHTHTYPPHTHTYPPHTHTYPLHAGAVVAPH